MMFSVIMFDICRETNVGHIGTASDKKFEIFSALAYLLGISYCTVADIHFIT